MAPQLRPVVTGSGHWRRPSPPMRQGQRAESFECRSNVRARHFFGVRSVFQNLHNHQHRTSWTHSCSVRLDRRLHERGKHMKIGIVTDSLADLSFEEMLDTAAELGISGIELNTSNWSSAPHADLTGLLDSVSKRAALLHAVQSRGLELFALNANGNQLHPTDGERQSKNLYDTMTRAAELGVPTVVCMSGLPGGCRAMSPRTGSPRRGHPKRKTPCAGSGTNVSCRIGRTSHDTPNRSASSGSPSSSIAINWSRTRQRCFGFATRLVRSSAPISIRAT